MNLFSARTIPTRSLRIATVFLVICASILSTQTQQIDAHTMEPTSASEQRERTRESTPTPTSNEVNAATSITPEAQPSDSTSPTSAPQVATDNSGERQSLTQSVRTRVTSATTAVARTFARAKQTLAERLEQRGKNAGANRGNKQALTAEDIYPAIDDINPSLWEGGATPEPNSPPCTDHADTEYHSLWNKEKGCHYDHTHGADPSQTIFKDIVAGWEQDISYPWQTFHENQNKHKGYFYLYTEAKNGCELGRYTNSQGCIRKLLYQLHSIGTNMEVTTRFHSFRFVAELCDVNQTNCGIVQGGGHSDYGTTHCPYKQEYCPKATDPVPAPEDGGVLPSMVTISQPPYVAVGLLSNITRIQNSGFNTQFWNGYPPNQVVSKYYPHKPNSLFGAAWSSVDGWTLIDPKDGYKEHFLCEDGSCKFNHSEFRLYSMRISLPQVASEQAFTTINGQINESCAAASATCAPLTISASVPKTVSTFYLDRKVNPQFAPEIEFDICFDATSGKPVGCNSENSVTSGWIKPQMMQMAM